MVMTADSKKYPPMTHDDLCVALNQAATWSIVDCAKALIVRLVAEVFRLRQAVRLQKRSKERLEELLHDAEHARTGQLLRDVAKLPLVQSAAMAVRGTAREMTQAETAVYQTGVSEGARRVLDELDVWQRDDNPTLSLADWIKQQRIDKVVVRG